MKVILKKWEDSFADRFDPGEAERRYKYLQYKKLNVNPRHRWHTEGKWWYRIHRGDLTSVDGTGGLSSGGLSFRLFEIIPENWLCPELDCLQFFEEL